MADTGVSLVGQHMADAFKDLNKTFDTESTALVPRESREVVVQPVITQSVTNEERQNDLAVTRETLHRIMNKAEDALDDILRLASASEHPRAFEVAGQMIKNVSDVAAQLIDLHKKAKELDKVSGVSDREERLNGAATIQNQTNVVFTGTPSDLLAALKLKREQEEKIIDV